MKKHIRCGIFSQRRKTSKIAVGGGEGWRQQKRAVGQNFKKVE